ncbi:MAG: TetR/AcrR family transcriptional regulator [Gammaproteobacteria bacterium]|nr:TetR/AcrR family transcriptional regulator [Gammaproteobacteria bacterium]
MALLRRRRSAPRSSAAVQRSRLINTARALLHSRRLTELTLSDVAARAEVPKSSAYHYFADIEDLYGHLLLILHQEVRAALAAPLVGPFASWSEVVARLIERGVRHFGADPAAQQLLVDPAASPDLRLGVFKCDVALGEVFAQQINAHFELPAVTDRPAVFFRAVEIAGLMFCLSFVDHGRITRGMMVEASRATVAYLGLYLPAKLPRRRAAPSGSVGANP